MIGIGTADCDSGSLVWTAGTGFRFRRTAGGLFFTRAFYRMFPEALNHAKPDVTRMGTVFERNSSRNLIFGHHAGTAADITSQEEVKRDRRDDGMRMTARC